MRAPLNRLPGWASGSFGYHGEDGLHFSGSGAGVPFGPPFTRQDGDVVGCVVNFVDRTLSYTRNGALLGVAVQNLPIIEPLYPCAFTTFRDFKTSGRRAYSVILQPCRSVALWL